MIYFKIIITLLLTINLAGYVNAEDSKKALTLRDIKSGQNYQVRVRTGNLAVDRSVYNAVKNMFSEYLSISAEASYTGYIEVLFSSSLGQGILGSKPAYATNVVYGDNWFTGSTDAEYALPLEVESNQGGILRWQKSQMNITIKDVKHNNFWSGEYTYKGMQDVAGLMNKTNEGANLCLDRIADTFKSDFNINYLLDEKGEIKPPAVALVVENRWMKAGKNSLGHSINVDSHTITYPSPDVLRVWAQSNLHEHKFMDLIEINCKNTTFKYLEGRLDKNPSLHPHSSQWMLIAPESTPDRILSLLCTE